MAALLLAALVSSVVIAIAAALPRGLELMASRIRRSRVMRNLPTGVSFSWFLPLRHISPGACELPPPKFNVGVVRR